MGVRMSRTPGGGSSKAECSHGKAGERGMGRMFSGNNFKSPAWNDIKKSKSRMGSQRSWAKMPDRYGAVSKNPSGASNKMNDS